MWLISFKISDDRRKVFYASSLPSPVWVQLNEWYTFLGGAIRTRIASRALTVQSS